jgi:hypothetical protein
MQYKIEQIGAEFSNKGITNLENRLNNRAEAGFKFHSVFQVQKPGCLGLTPAHRDLFSGVYKRMISNLLEGRSDLSFTAIKKKPNRVLLSLIGCGIFNIKKKYIIQ